MVTWSGFVCAGDLVFFEFSEPSARLDGGCFSLLALPHPPAMMGWQRLLSDPLPREPSLSYPMGHPLFDPRCPRRQFASIDPPQWSVSPTQVEPPERKAKARDSTFCLSNGAVHPPPMPTAQEAIEFHSTP